MKARLRALVVLTVGAVAASAPGCRRETAGAPPELRPGRDECVECGMLIAHDRFAAAARAAESDTGYVLFDDISCMLWYEREHGPPSGGGATFVKDYEGRSWIDGAGAHYLCAPRDRLKTPMGSGIVAYSSDGGARAALERFGGVVLDAAGLRERFARETAIEPGEGAGGTGRPD